ncbi:MAG TPA: hypothetical protein VGN63_19135 [Flavisolibacter sp.]|jgi:hypothetical protein|nr:hypothetical protein [Flavisolibacter sp.]
MGRAKKVYARVEAVNFAGGDLLNVQVQIAWENGQALGSGFDAPFAESPQVFNESIRTQVLTVLDQFVPGHVYKSQDILIIGGAQ